MDENESPPAKIQRNSEAYEYAPLMNEVDKTTKRRKIPSLFLVLIKLFGPKFMAAIGLKIIGDTFFLTRSISLG